MRKRGFTLLEVVIALVCAAIVLTSTVMVMSQVIIGGHRQHILSELQRDGEFVSQLMETEIRLAGLGVPFNSSTNSAGFFIMQDCSGSPVSCNFIYGTNSNGLSGNGAQLKFAAGRIIVASNSDIGFIGDLPRPDSNYNLFGPLDSYVTGDTTSIAWHTENNGSCVMPHCLLTTPDNLSLFFPTLANNAGSNCGAGSLRLTCPWASRRLAPGERLQIVAGDGNWSLSAASNSSPLNAITSTSGVVALPLAQSFDLGVDSSQSPAVNAPTWPNSAQGDLPQGAIGQGWVTSIDRVFYHFNAANKTIERVWCVGDPDPNNPRWPPDGSNALPASFTYTAPASSGMGGKTAATVCNGGAANPNEVVARHVQSLTFKYFDAAGIQITTTPTTSAATLNTIRRVDWTITLQNTAQQIGNVPVTFTIEGATALQN